VKKLQLVMELLSQETVGLQEMVVLLGKAA
jgi:hypothetical protein